MKTLKDRSRKNTVEAREVEHRGKRPAGTIDLTPTWSAILPVLLAVLEDGNEAGKTTARLELTRMAEIADRYVLEHKANHEPFAHD